MKNMLKDHDNAPDFSVSDQDGNTRSLKDFKDQNIVLWWYPKADTPGWTLEGKGFRDRIQDFKDKNAVVLGVSCDSPEDNAAFKEKFDFPFDLLCDVTREMSVAYGAADSPEAQNPKRISYLISCDGKISKAYATVKPAEHPAEVLSDLT